MPMNRCGGLSRCACLAIAAGVALGTPAFAQIDETISEQLSLEHFTLQSLAVPQELQQFHEIDVIVDGRRTTLVLLQHSVRAPGFQVMSYGADGALEPAPMPERHTYRGLLRGLPGSRVAASLHDGVLRAWIRDGDRIWAIQPAIDAEPGADPSLHVVYEAGDVLPVEGSCGVQKHALVNPFGAADGGTQPQGGGDKVCEIAFDADFEYFQLNGSSVPNTVADIESILNAVENIYINEVGIEYEITEIIVRNNVNDPYTTADPEALLSQFQQWWINNHADIHRDDAHLMTGKNLVGAIIGISFGGGICSDFFGFSLSQSKFSNNFILRTALTAHEVGHDWTADHCDGDPDCAIMCSAINACAGGVVTFGAAAETKILALKAGAPCLDDVIDSTATWNASISTPNGDETVDFGDEATITLSLDFDPDVDGENIFGLAAVIFDVLGDDGAADGHITGWTVLNSLAELTGDLTTTDGVSLFGVNAGQLTDFGPFTPADPLDVLEFGWTSDVNDTFLVSYDTATEAMFLWETDGDGDEMSVEWVAIETKAQFANLQGDDCPPDCNGDGALNILDFVCFQGLFVNGDLAADCNGDGVLNILDFVCFQDLFVQGC